MSSHGASMISFVRYNVCGTLTFVCLSDRVCFCVCKLRSGGETRILVVVLN